ncbi:hypothetical protein [Sphingobium bisphenolivorans]|uniref:hypothetical protein n=1 Tax=Sphingobium bisphenolivorans TaxID=1335760 RepID=UPI00187CCC31|nr:hypothetical protein [Sphingobium bisphenolivorans]
MTGHRLLPSGEQGRGMPQVRADQGGGGSPVLHGAKRRKGGETRLIAKRGRTAAETGQPLRERGRTAAETVQPLREGAGTGPKVEQRTRRHCRLNLGKSARQVIA